ncbi:hypothetical protein HK405_000061, partial [Cladochytrium tenue]
MGIQSPGAPPNTPDAAPDLEFQSTTLALDDGRTCRVEVWATTATAAVDTAETAEAVITARLLAAVDVLVVAVSSCVLNPPSPIKNAVIWERLSLSGSIGAFFTRERMALQDATQWLAHVEAATQGGCADKPVARRPRPRAVLLAVRGDRTAAERRVSEADGK